MNIRPAIAADAPGVRACVLAAFEPYVARIGRQPAPMLLDFPAHIARGNVWLVELQGTVAGVLVQYGTDDGFYIDTVAAHPAHRGTGVGRALLVFAEQEALRRGNDSLWLVTNSKMTENQLLYTKIGYVEFDRREQGGYARIFYRKRLR